MGLMPFLPGERPQSKTELEAWALERCRIHLPPALERMRLEWEKDERKAGDWSEVDPGRCLAMVESGLRFHLEEVERCFESDGGPNKEAWRQGERPLGPLQMVFLTSPLLEGILYRVKALFRGPRLGNSLGRGSLTQARQVYHDAIHPEHWFQGEYDLVYRWSGTPMIVDLKASVGANDRSGDYVEQLKMYAMLWYVTHNRDETVGGLRFGILVTPASKPSLCPMWRK